MSAYSRYEVPLGSAFKMAKKTLPTPKAWRDLSHHPFTPAKVLNGRRPSSPSSARTQKRGSNSRKWPRPGLSSSCYAVLSCSHVHHHKQENMLRHQGGDFNIPPGPRLIWLNVLIFASFVSSWGGLSSQSGRQGDRCGITTIIHLI